jgi:hypothetical protein
LRIQEEGASAYNGGSISHLGVAEEKFGFFFTHSPGQ